jgi:anti-sigma regulatory factor (Ser/Thr protein kinase)
VTAADGGEPSVVFHVPAVPRSSGIVRKGVSAFARRMRVPETELSQLLSALGEALANAIEHARAHAGAPIEVHCAVSQDRIVATVRDFGVGWPRHIEAGEAAAGPIERGRGFLIMRCCSDIFEVRSAPGGGTFVVVGRYFRLGLGTSSPRQFGQMRARAVPHGSQNVHS